MSDSRPKPLRACFGKPDALSATRAPRSTAPAPRCCSNRGSTVIEEARDPGVETARQSPDDGCWTTSDPRDPVQAPRAWAGRVEHAIAPSWGRGVAGCAGGGPRGVFLGGHGPPGPVSGWVDQVRSARRSRERCALALRAALDRRASALSDLLVDDGALGRAASGEPLAGTRPHGARLDPTPYGKRPAAHRERDRGRGGPALGHCRAFAARGGGRPGALFARDERSFAAPKMGDQRCVGRGLSVPRYLSIRPGFSGRTRTLAHGARGK